MDRQKIIEKIYTLILNEKISTKEREILVKYKLQLENEKNYDRKVVQDLKDELSYLAVRRELSKEVVEFLSYINKLTPGNRSRGSLFEIFTKKG